VTSGKVDWNTITWDELCERRVGKWRLFGEGTLRWLDYVVANVVIGSRLQWGSYFTTQELGLLDLAPYVTHEGYMKMLLTRHTIFAKGSIWKKDFEEALGAGKEKFERIAKRDERDERVEDDKPGEGDQTGSDGNVSQTDTQGDEETAKSDEKTAPTEGVGSPPLQKAAFTFERAPGANEEAQKEPEKQETATERKKREKAEKKAAEEPNKKAAEEKKAADKEAKLAKKAKDAQEKADLEAVEGGKAKK
jgi:hypothetical protein